MVERGLRTTAYYAAAAAIAVFVAIWGAGARADDTPAKAVKQSAPEYPESARSRGLEGWVEVEFTIGTDGVPHDVSIVDSDPHGVFDQSAAKAVQSWRYDPEKRGDVAIETHKRTKFVFKP
jgi:protein TonB